MFKLKDLFKRKPKVELDPLKDPNVLKEYTFEVSINLMDGSIPVTYNVAAYDVIRAERFALDRAIYHAEKGCSITRIPGTTLIVPPHFIKNIEVNPIPSSIKVSPEK
jgi:hypothetical protein